MIPSTTPPPVPEEGLPEWFRKPQKHPDYCDPCYQDTEAVLAWQFKHVEMLEKLVKDLSARCPPSPAGPDALTWTREAVERLFNAASELVEVASLRGDNDLPHPADDPKNWTARMQDAWDEIANAVEHFPAPEPRDPSQAPTPAPTKRVPTRIFRNAKGDRCSTCDGTDEHFHGYDDKGEVPGHSDGSDWLGKKGRRNA